jgi:hypothetical protein
MRPIASLASFALALLGGTAAAVAADIPQQYLASTTPPALVSKYPAQVKQTATSKLERAQDAAVLDGAFYAEIFPLYTGNGGNTSFLRLGNPTNHASVFHITVVGSPSGNLDGQGDITVPAYATPQYVVNDVLSAASATALDTGDTTYSLYITNDDDASFYQHVIFNGNNQFFEDVTICPMGASIQGDKTVTTIHTSLLSAFPSTVYIHNMLSVQAEYRVVVRLARTGVQVGTIPSLKANANATYAIPFSFFEQQIGFTPVAGQEHAILEFHASTAFAQALGAGLDPADVGGVFGQAVLNNAFGAVLNLSNKCRVNR